MKAVSLVCMVDGRAVVQIWADPAKIERVMGWHAKYTNVEESLAHAWAWRQKHPHGYPRAVGAAA